MKTKGFFISFEGGEGCGKTTQLTLLANDLKRIFPNREIIATRSPGGTPLAEKLRSVLKEQTNGETLTPESELLLFAACHSQMVKNMILPAIERGAILITDRFVDSTVVYQGIARSLGKDLVRSVNNIAFGYLKPDLTFLFDLEPEIAYKRTHFRSELTEQDRFDSESLSFHHAIRNGFLELAKEDPERFIVLDASEDIACLHKQIMEALHGRLEDF